MRRLITMIAVVVALLWSGLIWAGYALLAFSADLLANGTSGFGLTPEIDQLAMWVASIVERFGSGTAIVIWLIGLAAIWLVRTIVNRIVGGVSRDSYSSSPTGDLSSQARQRPPGNR